MKVSGLELQNFRSFEQLEKLRLGSLNVLIGPNNSGKSSILKALHMLQSGIPDPFPDVRIGSKVATIRIHLDEMPPNSKLNSKNTPMDGIIEFNISSEDRRTGSIGERLKVGGSSSSGSHRFQNQEPNHFIVPYLSKRKTVSYVEDIREHLVASVVSDMSNLAAKLSRIGNPHFPAYQKYADACRQILGFVVTAIPSQNGQRPGIYLPNRSALPIDQMGEGVPNIVHMLANLAVSEGKLFLIEEPENDLHPEALKALLDLIIESSARNQFVISTHSNIVVSHLCGRGGSYLYRVSSEIDQLPTLSKVEAVDPSPKARIDVLRELGYSFSDIDLWDGWLILEESSAERLIREYLIPWFAPALKRLRTFAAGGIISKVEATYEDFHRLVLFTHLQPAYKGRSWVRVDGDAAGQELCDRLKGKFRDGDTNEFSTFSKANFEEYYPRSFAERVGEVLVIQDRQQKREAKRLLLDELVFWIDEDADRAKQALEESAAEIIADLRIIQALISGKKTIA